MTHKYWCSACGRPIGLMLDLQGYSKPFYCPNSGRVGEMIGYIGRHKPVEASAE